MKIMYGERLAVRKRINVTLSEETIRLMGRVSKKGDRSRLIDEAVKHYVEVTRKGNLAERLKEGASRRAERDLALADDWFSVEEEAWLRDHGR